MAGRALRRTLVFVGVGILLLGAAWSLSRLGSPRIVWARVAPTRLADVELRDAPDGELLGDGSYAASLSETDRSVRVIASGFRPGPLHALLERLGLRLAAPPAVYRLAGGVVETSSGTWREYELLR